MSALFDKPQQMLPAEAVAVAGRRLGDARALADTGDDERASGAMYMAGLAVEVLLKGQLIRTHPVLQLIRRPPDADMSRRHDLVWRKHDLDGLLQELPSLLVSLDAHDARTGGGLVVTLRTICTTWTIFARYSVVAVTAEEAAKLVRDVIQLEGYLQ